MYNPGIEYRGDQSLFEGASRGIGNLQTYLLQKADEHKQQKNETAQADTAFQWLAPLLNNDEQGITDHGDQLAKFPSMSLSQKKATIGGLTMYLANKAEQEKAKATQQLAEQRTRFNQDAAAAFGPDGIDLGKLSAAVQQNPQGVDMDKLLGIAQKVQEAKATAATDKRNAPFFSPTGAPVEDLSDQGAVDMLRIVTGPNSAIIKPKGGVQPMSAAQKYSTILKVLSQSQSLGDPLKNADLSADERSSLVNQYNKLGKELGVDVGGGPAKSKQPLTTQAAQDFLQQAGGDKTKARKMAKDAGYDF
jgi:hypothetical protein